jgi:undecaprenyl-diphosphatase
MVTRVITRLKSFATRVGLHEQVVLVALLLISGGIWAFVSLAGEVQEGDTKRFDEAVLRAFRDPNDMSRPVGPEWVQGIGHDITALGGVAVLTLLTGAVAGYLLLVRKRHAAVFVLVASLGALVLSSTLKYTISRDRPDIVPHLQKVYTSSFPSGHSMMSSAIYLTLGTLLARLVPERRAKVYFLTLSLALAFFVGLSRVYLGVHYPTDVLAGWTAGLAWALLCWLAARVLQKKGAVEKDYEKTPPAAPAIPD